MTTLIAAFAVLFILSVVPGDEISNYRQSKTVFWSIDPVICGNM